MAETLALTRFCLFRYWRWTAFLALSVVVGVVSSGIAMQIDSSGIGAKFVGFAILLTFMPAAFFSLALFDYGGLSALEIGHSGCSHWVLRMPVHSWKIAFVPIVLKTLWIMGLWVAFLVTVHLMGADDLPLGKLMMAGIAIAASGVWFSGVAWRPFSHGLWRLLSMGLAGALCLSSFVVVMMLLDLEDGTAHRHNFPIREHLPWLSVFLPITAYISGVAYTFHAVEYARTRSRGAIPESPSKLLHFFSDSEIDVQREHKSPRRALIWYKLAQAAPWIKKVAVFWLPIVIACSLLMQLHVASVVFVFGLTVYAGIFVCVNSDAKPNQGRYRTTLPSFLARAPMGTATLAWTRFATHLTILTCVLGSGMLVFVGMSLWPENRDIWWQWASERAAAAGVPDAAFSTGMRWTVAIVLGVNLWLLCRWVGISFIGYAGRESWTTGFAITAGVCALIVLSIPFSWFLKNATSWDNIQESAIGWLYYLPHVVGVLLALKMISIFTATTWLVKSNLVSDRGVLKVMFVWFGLVVGLGLFYSVLIPHPAATIPWCIAATVLSIPLSRFLILPVMLQYNRCR